MFAVLGTALFTAGCGGDGSTVGSPSQSHPAPGQAAASFEHVHGLGIDPRDGALFIATHTGLFRAGRDNEVASRVGDSAQDVMGFTIAGGDRFLGSGHPDPRAASQPASLGLISSADGGRSWTSVSLSGRADFHVLRSRGRNVFGFNGLTGKLMVSADAGRTWQERTPPGPLIDLAVDPRDVRHLVASTDTELSVSRDGGGSWRPLRRGAVGLLVWPRGDRLFWIDAQGTVHRSTNAGRSWQETTGSIDGQPAAFASHGEDLYAALATGTVVRSSDLGRTWTVRATP